MRCKICKKNEKQFLTHCSCMRLRPSLPRCLSFPRLWIYKRFHCIVITRFKQFFSRKCSKPSGFFNVPTLCSAIPAIWLLMCCSYLARTLATLHLLHGGSDGQPVGRVWKNASHNVAVARRFAELQHGLLLECGNGGTHM